MVPPSAAAIASTTAAAPGAVRRRRPILAPFLSMRLSQSPAARSSAAVWASPLWVSAAAMSRWRSSIPSRSSKAVDSRLSTRLLAVRSMVVRAAAIISPSSVARASAACVSPSSARARASRSWFLVTTPAASSLRTCSSAAARSFASNCDAVAASACSSSAVDTPAAGPVLGTRASNASADSATSSSRSAMRCSKARWAASLRSTYPSRWANRSSVGDSIPTGRPSWSRPRRSGVDAGTPPSTPGAMPCTSIATWRMLSASRSVWRSCACWCRSAMSERASSSCSAVEAWIRLNSPSTFAWSRTASCSSATRRLATLSKVAASSSAARRMSERVCVACARSASSSSTSRARSDSSKAAVSLVAALRMASYDAAHLLVDAPGFRCRGLLDLLRARRSTLARSTRSGRTRCHRARWPSPGRPGRARSVAAPPSAGVRRTARSPCCRAPPIPRLRPSGTPCAVPAPGGRSRPGPRC